MPGEFRRGFSRRTNCLDTARTIRLKAMVEEGLNRRTSATRSVRLLGACESIARQTGRMLGRGLLRYLYA